MVVKLCIIWKIPQAIHKKTGKQNNFSKEILIFKKLKELLCNNASEVAFYTSQQERIRSCSMIIFLTSPYRSPHVRNTLNLWSI